jgi:hypothetical protein
MLIVKIVGKDKEGKPIKQITLKCNYINNDERFPAITRYSNGDILIKGTDDQIKVLISDLYHQFEDE